MGTEVVPDGCILRRVDRLLRDRHETRADMCRRLGIHPNTVGNWAKEERSPNVAVLFKVANYLSVTMEYLWVGRDANHLDNEDLLMVRQFMDLSDKSKQSIRFLVKGLLADEQRQGE